MRTQKRQNKKSYTIFQTGNIAIVTRIPIGGGFKRKRLYGGESDNEYLQTEVFQNLVAALRAKPAADASVETDEKKVAKYLESLKLTSEKSGLLRFIFSKQSDRGFDNFFDALKTRKLNMRNATISGKPENKLFVLLLNKVNAQQEVAKIKDAIAKIPDMDEATKVAAVNTLENGASMSVSSVSASTMNALRKGSHSLAAIFAPETTATKNRRNETDVEILFFDQDHQHYRKGNSQPAIKEGEKRFGDVVIINRPTKYADTQDFISEMSGSVEDVLARIATSGENILCADDSDKCKKYSVKRKPYMRRVMHIVNKKPVETKSDETKETTVERV